MAIKQLNYLDIPEEARKKAGTKRLAQLKYHLIDRSLTTEQRKAVEDEIKLVNSWVAGRVPTDNPGVDHVLVVSEDLRVSEG